MVYEQPLGIGDAGSRLRSPCPREGDARHFACLLWLSLLALSAPTADAQYFPPPESSGGWRRLVSVNATPTATQKQDNPRVGGHRLGVLKQAWDASSLYGGSFLVIRNGWIVGEWGTTTTAFAIASCTKSVTSLAMQRLFDMSAAGSFTTTIGPDDLAFQYLPSSWGNHPIRQTISIRHLLTMSSGLEPDDNPPSPSSGTSAYLQKLLNPPVRTTPGSEWSYASLPVDTLSLVVEQVSGSRLGDFFQQQIGSKIGVTTLQWGALGTHSYASAYAKASARDLARIAYLLLRRGSWNGQSIVSAARIDEMVRWDSILAGASYGPQVQFPTDPESHLRYGHLVWTNRTESPFVGTGVPADAYYFAGFRTKFVLVVPSLDLIAVRIQDGPGAWSDALFAEAVTKLVEAVVKEQPNAPPSAELVQPSEGMVFSAPASIMLAANASDSDGVVTQVEFFANGSAIGISAGPPYQISWEEVPIGSYALTARSTDNAGASTTSPAIHVTVVSDYSVTPDALAFGSQPMNVESDAQEVTVANEGAMDLPISSISLTGPHATEFTFTTTCGSSLPSGSNCVISVRFKPASTGTRSASLHVAGDSGVVGTVALSGTGTSLVASFAVSPTSLAFGKVRRGSMRTKNVTISNNGSVMLPILSIGLSGSNPGQFGVTHDCGSSVAVGSSCVARVTFKPTSTGQKSAKLVVTANAGAGTKSVSLKGTGT